jgi:hypothetical protein
MNNGGEGSPFLIGQHHLEKTLNIGDTMHYLLWLSLQLMKNQLDLVGNLVDKGRHMVQWRK